VVKCVAGKNAGDDSWTRGTDDDVSEVRCEASPGGYTRADLASLVEVGDGDEWALVHKFE
jgi:hypothetical protein